VVTRLPARLVALRGVVALALLMACGHARADTLRFGPGTPLAATSGNVANSSAVATLAAAPFQRTTYITGFWCGGGGATAGSVVTISVSGLLGGTQTFPFGVPAGVTGWNYLPWRFPAPVPASSTQTAIVVTMPALGSGNTNAACQAWGFQL
jgi:hypothetical protein